MRHLLTVIAASAVIAGSVAAAAAQSDTEGYYITTSGASFEDTMAALNDAVINRGLVIDYTGQVGEMLARTADAVNMETPYLNASYLHFCSAKFTHGVVAANPENIAVCPYVVFAYELKAEPGSVHVGYRKPIGAPGSESTLGEVDALLREIVSETAE
jgi:uncharacterized protein (DUF302 family)